MVSTSSFYSSKVISSIPRLLSQLDREPHSLNYGSFDRQNWGWKFNDFPLTMLQIAVYPLALLWRNSFSENPYYQNAQLLRWIKGSLKNTLDRQHGNGSFDSVGPYTQDHGVTLAMVYLLTETRKTLKDVLDQPLDDRIRTAVDQACEFAQKSDEDYAFISNHQSLFALAYHNAHELSGNHVYQEQSEQIITRILEEQSSDGWYQEYDGPDPGYESLGIFYLAVYWQRTGSERVLESLQRSLAFYKYFIHPDGSAGGVYGSRHTSLYFPGGFEILKSVLPDAAAIAHFMRERLDNQNVLTPQQSDIQNLPVLCYAYLTASMQPEIEPDAEIPALPCETAQTSHYFPDSRLHVRSTKRYYAVVNCAKGGVIRVFDKASENCIYEDAGYLLNAGGKLLTSQMIGLGKREDRSAIDQVICKTSFARSQQEMLTPAKFILLRLLNLTLFRSIFLGSLIRRVIVGRLIQDRRVAPARLFRAISFGEEEIHFLDRIDLQAKIKVDRATLPRVYTAIHMGSARYFHPSELNDLSQIPLYGMVENLNKEGTAEIKFTVRFSDSEQPKIIIEQPDISMEKTLLEDSLT